MHAILKLFYVEFEILPPVTKIAIENLINTNRLNFIGKIVQLKALFSRLHIVSIIYRH